jgi:hypothetical protein
MKQKDIMYIVLAGVIFVGAGFLAYTQLMPHQSGPKKVEVEVVGVIPDKLSEKAMDRLTDPTTVVDFNLPVDLQGLGNAKPFGQ